MVLPIALTCVVVSNSRRGWGELIAFVINIFRVVIMAVGTPGSDVKGTVPRIVAVCE